MLGYPYQGMNTRISVPSFGTRGCQYQSCQYQGYQYQGISTQLWYQGVSAAKLLVPQGTSVLGYQYQGYKDWGISTQFWYWGVSVPKLLVPRGCHAGVSIPGYQYPVLVPGGSLPGAAPAPRAPSGGRPRSCRSVASTAPSTPWAWKTPWSSSSPVKPQCDNQCLKPRTPAQLPIVDSCVGVVTKPGAVTSLQVGSPGWALRTPT